MITIYIFFLFKVACLKGFEPLASCSVDRRSIQLSYGYLGAAWLNYFSGYCLAERAGFEPAVHF